MPTGMRGPAEADETYVGGRVPNMSLRRRHGHAGSGPAGKAVAAGVRDRETGQVAVRVVGGATARELQGMVRDHVEPGARLYTDEATVVRAGMSHRAAGARFGVSAANVSRWRALEREQGDARPKALGGDRRSGRIEAQRGVILSLLGNGSMRKFVVGSAVVAVCAGLLASNPAKATEDCRGDDDERWTCEREKTARLVARLEAKTKALNGVNECARLVIETSAIVAGASMGLRPEEITDAVKRDRAALEKRFNEALDSPVNLLSNILRSLILLPDDEEHRVVDQCIASLK